MSEHSTIHVGDCLEWLRTLPDASVDSCVTDPPYGLGKEPDPREVLAAWLSDEQFKPGGRGFMGKAWDAFVPSPLVWAEVFRVLKPGGHLLAFAGSRTYDWIALGVRLAGFEIRDQLMWIYGSGFSKGFNLRRMPEGTFCDCENRGNPVPYSNGKQTTEHDMRSLRRSDLPEAVNAQGERGQVLLPSMPESGARQDGATRPESEPATRSESGVEGRILHRAGQGLPDAPYAGASSSAGEWLRARAYRDRGAEDRATAGSGGSGAPHQPRPGGQPAGEPASVREPRGALDGGALAGCHRCACGKLRAEYEGFGTGIKPSHEPIVLARKPFRGSVAANVLEHGTGAINVDGCRVATSESLNGGAYAESGGRTALPGDERDLKGKGMFAPGSGRPGEYAQPQGRWPANIMHDGSPEVVAGFPFSKSTGGSASLGAFRGGHVYGKGRDVRERRDPGKGDQGSAARFFYSPKASRKEREWGLDALGDYRGTTDDGREVVNDTACQRGKTQRRNIHPTVKPVALIGYLQRLITPPGGVTIDPYLGSGTAAMAATWEGFTCHGCELDTAHATIAHLRHAYALDNPCPYDQPKQEPEAEPGAQLDIFGGES